MKENAFSITLIVSILFLIIFTVLNYLQLLQSVTADNIEFRDIAAVDIWQRQDISIPLLYDPGSGLPERIISEQFAP